MRARIKVRGGCCRWGCPRPAAPRYTHGSLISRGGCSHGRAVSTGARVAGAVSTAAASSGGSGGYATRARAKVRGTLREPRSRGSRGNFFASRARVCVCAGSVASTHWTRRAARMLLRMRGVKVDELSRGQRDYCPAQGKSDEDFSHSSKKLETVLGWRKAMEEPTDGKGNPGASRHGNFINYYQFHPALERVRQLPKAVCRADSGRTKFVGLDVGCNAGDLTLELHKFLVDNLPGREVAILGIDLDPKLVERAREKNDRPSEVTFECLDFLSSERENVVGSFLAEHQVERFDASFCFSITMWIHLNGGDAALERFLEDVCGLSESLLLEPQPWRCYREASRRLRRADLAGFPQLAGLRYRGDVAGHIDRILTERCAFRRLELTEANDWRRRLMLYERKDASGKHRVAD